MDPARSAPLYIAALRDSAPQDGLPPAQAVTERGNAGTQTVKRIVLGRLAGAVGHGPHRYTGDTYNCPIDGEEARFNFRVSADPGRKHWWSNTSISDLDSLIEDEAVILAVWHPPGQGRWMQQIVAFAIPPAILHAGITAHLPAILRTMIRATLERMSASPDDTPGLIPSVLQALGAANLQALEPLPGQEQQRRDQLAEALAAYRNQQPAGVNALMWKEARHQAQKTREKLVAIMIQIVRHPQAGEGFRIIHQNSNSVLMDLPPDLSTDLQLGDFERKQLHQAYGAAAAVEPERVEAGPAESAEAEAPNATPTAPQRPDALDDAPVPAVELNPVELTLDRLRPQLAGLPLDELVARIWAAIDAGKHVVLTGAPGTAKTTIALAVAGVAAETDRCSTFMFTTATTDWTALDTVGGYVPNTAANGRGLVFQPGKFLECFRDPESQEQDFRWLVIDELNRAEVDKAFGQFFTVLSGQPCELPFHKDHKRVVILPDDWHGDQSLLYDKAASYVYRVPRKWRMLATLNTDDKASLFEMSYAFLRRFAFIHIPLPTPEGLEQIGNAVLRTRVGLDEATTVPLLALWRSIIAVRPLGPALLIDMAQYLRSRRATDDGRWAGSVAEAVAQFVVPQLEGLDPEQLSRFRSAVTQKDARYWTTELQEACTAFLPAMREVPGDGADDADEGGDGDLE